MGEELGLDVPYVGVADDLADALLMPQYQQGSLRGPLGGPLGGPPARLRARPRTYSAPFGRKLPKPPRGMPDLPDEGLFDMPLSDLIKRGQKTGKGVERLVTGEGGGGILGRIIIDADPEVLDRLDRLSAEVTRANNTAAEAAQSAATGAKWVGGALAVLIGFQTVRALRKGS